MVESVGTFAVDASICVSLVMVFGLCAMCDMSVFDVLHALDVEVSEGRPALEAEVSRRNRRLEYAWLGDSMPTFP